MLLAKRFGGKRLTAGLRKPPARSHLQRVGHRNDDRQSLRSALVTYFTQSILFTGKAPVACDTWQEPEPDLISDDEMTQYDSESDASDFEDERVPTPKFRPKCEAPEPTVACKNVESHNEKVCTTERVFVRNGHVCHKMSYI